MSKGDRILNQMIFNELTDDTKTPQNLLLSYISTASLSWHCLGWAWHQIFVLLKTHHLPLGNGSELKNKLHHKSTSRMGVLTHLCQFSPLLPRRREIIIKRQHYQTDGRHLWVKFLQFSCTILHIDPVRNEGIPQKRKTDI